MSASEIARSLPEKFFPRDEGLIPPSHTSRRLAILAAVAEGNTRSLAGQADVLQLRG
jgi:hypothetical protein